MKFNVENKYLVTKSCSDIQNKLHSLLNLLVVREEKRKQCRK